MSIFILFALACGPQSEKVEILPGSPPDFSMPSDGFAYIPITDIIEAYDNEARFVIIDARPTVDYNLRHITGAYSVPFYEVDDHIDRFPLNEWYVTYCACPHSESGIVAQALLDAGHETVGIIDEGYLEWEALGYPTTEGEERQ
jgi:rhodanese-related sulfurtransferase